MTALTKRTHWVVRVTHWVNVIALPLMVATGLRIFNAYPAFARKGETFCCYPFANKPIPAALTFGGWLAGAYLWDYNLPSYSQRAGDTNGYYLLSQVKDVDRETLKAVLSRLPNGDSLDDETFMAGYWQMKTGREWNPRKVVGEMALVNLPELKEAALEILKSQKVGLVLSDINMPNMDGLELLGRIKAAEEWRKVPVIMITTEGAAAKVQEAVALGASGYVRKPFTAEQIKEKLTGLL